MDRFTLPVDYTQLTQPQRRLVRLQYIEEQGGSCTHCKAPLNGPPPAEIMDKWINKRLFPVGFLITPYTYTTSIPLA